MGGPVPNLGGFAGFAISVLETEDRCCAENWSRFTELGALQTSELIHCCGAVHVQLFGGYRPVS
jgi:hypothetical protein